MAKQRSFKRLLRSRMATVGRETHPESRENDA